MCHLLLERRSNRQITVLFVITYVSVIFFPVADENKKYLLKIKESLLILRDKPSLNRDINSASLYLFDKVSEQGISRNPVSLFNFKYHYKILKKNIFTRLKHDLIICRDMSKTRRQNLFLKNLGLVENCRYFFHLFKTNHMRCLRHVASKKH